MSHCSGCGGEGRSPHDCGGSSSHECGDGCSHEGCKCDHKESSAGYEDISLSIKNFSVEAGRASLKIVTRFPAVKKPRISGNKLFFKLRPGLEISRIKSLLREKGIETA